MKTEIAKLPKSEIELKIEVPTEEWQEFIDEAAQEFSRDLKIEGFRPGKAPFSLVEEKIGLAKILEEAAEHCVHKCYVRAIMDKNIIAIGKPEISVTKIAKDNPFEFRARVAVMPEVKSPDYKKIAKDFQKDKKEVKVEEEEIEKSISWLLKSRAKYSTVNRPAAAGDRVEIDFEGSCEGQKLAELASKNHPAILGQSQFIPGFEDNLIGMKEGEEKEFDILFPENFSHKHLAGKIVNFKAKMNLVQESEIPEFSDDFAKSLGNFENINSLKENIKEGLLMEKQMQEKDNWRAKVLDEIAKKSEMEIPDILIIGETQRMLDELKAKINQLGLDYSQYIEKIQKKESEIIEEFKPKAEQRVRAFLVLQEIAKQENISVSEEDLTSEVNKTLEHFKSPEHAQKNIDIEQLKVYTEGVLKNEKVFQLLENH
ncbi:MAG: trigger factor [Candidatus Portnoybacteria bacterium]|nr:trigger factor [Candidatus Portnoybacteria bacterium]